MKSSQKYESDEYKSFLSSKFVQSNKGNYVILEPRDYQLEVFHFAQKQNAIAFLDTGSGKYILSI